MKKSLLKFGILLLAVPILFIGCKKAELTDVTLPNTNITKEAPVYCGTPTVANLFEDFIMGEPLPTTSFGTVTVGNDAAKLYVTYDITPGWELKHAFLYVGTEADLIARGYGENLGFNGDFTGEFHIALFPHQYFPEPYVQSYSFEFLKDSLPNCVIVVAFTEIVNSSTLEHKYVSAKVTTGLKHYGYYLNYCMQQCGSCETVYARGDNGGGVTRYCFYNAPLNLNNWGWTHKLDPAGGPISFSWPIYAGNPSCDPMNEPVGYFTGTYDGSILHVMYDLAEGYTLDETHLWVGQASTNAHPYLYWKNGKYVAAPGKYTYNNVFEEGVYKDIPVSGIIFVAAHGVACGVFE